MIGPLESLAPQSVEEVQEAVLQAARLLPRGGGTKPALSTPPAAHGAAVLDLGGLAGILAYDPGEFTFTARAGTPLAQIEAALAENGQYLPFDPPLAQSGATLGGTVAAGLSGARRHRYGGLRDFLLGIRFVDGQGRLVRGGGKVVKNAAGVDLPKLLTGSLGRLGVLVEVTFKVFPNPPAFATLRLPCRSLAETRASLRTLATAPLDIESVDVTMDEGPVLWVRIGGLAGVLGERAARLCSLLGGGETLAEGEDARFWRQAAEFAWVPPGAALARVSLNPHLLETLAQEATSAGAAIRFSAAGHVAWIAWNQPAEHLDALLARLGLSGLLLRGKSDGSPLLGVRPDAGLLGRISGVLDPSRRFLPLLPEP